jgi:hypothetical protein
MVDSIKRSLAHPELVVRAYNIETFEIRFNSRSGLHMQQRLPHALQTNNLTGLSSSQGWNLVC